ncbi:Ig-like domain-containing protein, partial [Aliarcobacter butzleri]|uniref:Ig-like domain-containing protein n=1 Tax=Aliarcobacter butzleri TaxID=28197 RepID=UPI00125FE161
MAQVGIVKTLEGGVFYAKDSSGNIRELSIGDSISENEVVYGDSSNQISAKVEMELSGNDIIVLNQAQQQLIDSSLNQVTFGNEEVIFTKGDINTTFENADLSAWNNTTNDVSDDMETAAGDPTQQETQAGQEEPTEEGRVTARFSTRDGSSTNVQSDLRELADFGTQSETGNGADEIPAGLRNLQNTTVTPTTPVQPDTTLPEAEITIDVIAEDGVINLKESQETNTTITGTVGKDVKAGDTVTVSVNGKDYPTTVNADGKTWSVEVKTSDLLSDSDKQVEAKVTTKDSAGNEATASADKGYAVDTTLPEAEITIDVIAEDGVINLKESQETNTTITGTVGKDVKAGDTVTVSVNGKDYPTTVNADGKTWSVEVKTSDLLSDSDKQVEAKVTTKDSAGNEATASADKGYAVDTT